MYVYMYIYMYIYLYLYMKIKIKVMYLLHHLLPPPSQDLSKKTSFCYEFYLSNSNRTLS